MSNNEDNIEEFVTDDLGDQDTVKEEVEANGSDLLKEIKDLQDEANKHKENYLRSVADLENYRRRMVREKEELRKNVAYSVIEDFLPIIDNMMLGIDAAKNNDASENILQGFEMVLSQFKSILADHEVKELNPQGALFDPNEHECVSLVPNPDVEENKIINVVRVGYRLQDRLIRPASVVVSSGPEKQLENED